MLNTASFITHKLYVLRKYLVKEKKKEKNEKKVCKLENKKKKTEKYMKKK